MPYNELIKNFDRIRKYIREFYVYGFKSRDEYDEKSGRSYDDERRRIESYLGVYMRFVRSKDKKKVFISIDSRETKHNPLYKAWKTKSFTDGDITLHFILFDILNNAEKGYTVSEIIEIMDSSYLADFRFPMTFDESTVRKKLKEYVENDVVRREKRGKQTYYFIGEKIPLPTQTAVLDFFSETLPCGVIGSFILDKYEKSEDIFTFKHHYITSTTDSNVLVKLFYAMREKRYVTISKIGMKTKDKIVLKLLPLRIFISVQNGRQNLLAYCCESKSIQSFRVDYLDNILLGEVSSEFDDQRKKLDEMQGKMWGVSCKKRRGGNETETVEFEIKIKEWEKHIINRLEREKRIGTIEKIDEETYKFHAEVYDSEEMVPWIRTFIGRISKMNFSNRTVENVFKSDINKLYEAYGITENSGGECE